MGTGGRICEVCGEFTSLLQSYDGKRTNLTCIEDITISREEVETIFLYLQSWTQRQCSCCFRDHRNFERFNWAIQILVIIVVEVIKRLGMAREMEGQHGESTEEGGGGHSAKRAVWDVEDKDKLVHFVAKIFLNTFPTYVAYKQFMQSKNEEVTAHEVQQLGLFCEINEPEASPYLFRNVALFCNVRGMEAITECLKSGGPETLFLHQVNILVTLATNVKSWMNFGALVRLYVPLRSAALSYMCKLVDTELKTASARNMAEYIWSAVKDPVDAHVNFDKDGLDLAFRYFMCPTLTMRLAGVSHINGYINMFNELLNTDHIRDPDTLYESLCRWLLDNQIIQHIFGPNLHVEVIKQSHTILSFLAMENQFTNEHVEIIWAAAQLKHCSKQVFDVLSSLICHMEPGPVLHLHNLLKQLEPKDHSEHSLYLASALIKFIWTNAASALEEQQQHGISGGQIVNTNGSGSGGSLVSVPASSSSPSGSRRLTKGKRGPEEGESSSENSVSVEGSPSHSEDDENVQPPTVPGPLTIRTVPRGTKKVKQPLGSGSGSDGPLPTYFKPTCHLSGGDSSSSDDTMSEDDDDDDVSASDIDPDGEVHQVSSSGGYVETHSDSDADEEHSGNEDNGVVTGLGKRGSTMRKRKVLRRKKRRCIVSGPVKPLLRTRLRKVASKSLSGNEASHNSSGELKPSEEALSLDATTEAGAGNQAISQLGSMVQMQTSNLGEVTAPEIITSQPILPEFTAELLEGSDGSYSSRMSTKSEKNMADFDGEDSNCDEDLVGSLSQNQLIEIAAANRKARNSGCPVLLPPRAMRMFFRRKRFQSQSATAFNFHIENVCQPGQTLLWDLIQDDKIGQLSEGLAVETQKALTNLLCYGADKLIRLKFIEGCLENIERNRSVVVSLRLLPKLLTSFNQMRLPHGGTDVHQVTLWAEKEHGMLEKFFRNLHHLQNMDFSSSPFPFYCHVQARLEFLTSVFSGVTSPDDFRLTVSHVDELWGILATDSKCSDDFFLWLTAQVRSRDQHALSHETFRHILINKIPSLPPETITVHSLSLFQQLCNLARLAVLQDVDVGSGGTPVASMDYLWKIALYACNTDVSMTAIQHLNNYYIGRQMENEQEFIERSMKHLSEAREEVVQNMATESTILRIQRGLLLLKSHLEMFRRRYAFHLRKWALEGKGVGSHAQLVGDKGAVPIRICIQPANFNEKVTLEMVSTDFVADLRAEVVKWWESIQGANGPMDTSSSNSTPVLGSLLSEGPIRMITQGIELSAEYDEKCLSDIPIKDLQLVYVSMGATRPQRKRGDVAEYSSSLPPPSRDKLPVTLLLQKEYFEQLFSLMHSLAEVKSGSSVPHTKVQVLSRRVWDILMLLPTNPEIYNGFKTIRTKAARDFETLLDPSSPQKLMYSLYIVESLVKQAVSLETDPDNKSWKEQFVDQGGLRHLFDIFTSGILEFSGGGKEWSEWKQDCLASLLKILCYLGVVPEETEYLNELLYDVNESPKKRMKRRKGSNTEKSPIPRLNEMMLSSMKVDLVMTRLTNILQACAQPRDPNNYKTGFWGRAQVVHYAMALLVCWAFSEDTVRSVLYKQADFSTWLRRLVLEDPEPVVRREICMGLYRLCLGISADGNTGVAYTPELLAHLLKSLKVALSVRWNQQQILLQQQVRFDGGYSVVVADEGKEAYGPACRDYFWLLCRLLDSLEESFVRSTIEHPENCVINLDNLAVELKDAIECREYLETRHNTVCDDGLVGLLNLMVVTMKHNPPFKTSLEGQRFLKVVFDSLFALPSPQRRYLPKCKSQPARSAAYDLLAELAKNAPENYFLLQSLLIEQHQSIGQNSYPWDYWPHEDGRASCGYVGLTNLGATCYMASCMQHLYMMPQARASILGAKECQGGRYEQTLGELQRMFAYLMESERKAFNPRGFCKVYQMDHKPLNTGEQKDMAEFFIDLVSKLEEMTPELKKLVKNLFCGVTSNNVVSLDCHHVSRTLEEFYTVRCQVADMRSLYESLDEVTVKDTLEGDNMYTCSTCGKKVRAEKRACFKKLPKVLCFNTMRYTFNMLTMMKEKVNTHFSFPLQLDMSGYVEKTLMPQQYQEEKEKAVKESLGQEEEEEEFYIYDLIGVTVHTGTADGGHYYCFIRDRIPPNRDKWYLFNDAEVKQFDPAQLPAECFGGEMNTKTYDSVTEKFMDFSFEKTNSAYMLFYERSPNGTRLMGQSSGQDALNLPGGSSQGHQQFTVPLPQPSPTLSTTSTASSSSSNTDVVPTFELTKELEEWIWMDNTQFLRDKNIFEHTYFNFMSQVCCQIPSTLQSHEDAVVLAAKLTATFILETYIHAKEKPTFVQWMEFLTKQLMMTPPAAVWFLDHMASDQCTWIAQILLKCPNQMVRQMFGRLCFCVVQSLRGQQLSLYMKMPHGFEFEHPDQVKFDHFGHYSCVSRFIKKFLSLLDSNARSSLKYLAEYFTFLHDFTKLGDEECLMLINLQTIARMVAFYLGNNRKETLGDFDGGGGGILGSEEEEEEEIISIPTEKSKLASLERMIALIATLVEKSRDEHTNELRLSKNDRDALYLQRKSTHYSMFPFILQQIRDNINLSSTRNLVFSLCRWQDKLAEDVVIAVFQAIQKHPDACHPFFKLLNLLAEVVGGPPGMPKFAELILSRILDVSEICPYPTLEWLGAQVPRNKIVHSWCLQSMATWVEHFLITNNNQRVRSAAAQLLVSLVPHQQFRTGYRGPKAYGLHQQHSLREPLIFSVEALHVLHEIYDRLLKLLKPARHYTDVSSHGTSKLIAYFNVMTYFTVSKTEKLLFTPYFVDLWNLFHPRLSEPSIPSHHNKAALLTFWHHVSSDCPENVQRIVSNPNVVKQIGFNYILADHEDQEVVLFNRGMLPAYYGILKMCCQHSRPFALQLARHQNITWAFKNISPYQTQYPTAVEELFKMMQIITQKGSDTSEQELHEVQVFKRNTLQLFLTCLDGRSFWTTIISAFRILIETVEDRIFVVMNGGLNLLFEAISMLHTMHHEATACNIVGELVELLSMLTEILRSFRPKEFAHGMQTMANGEIAIQRAVSNAKEWPEVLKKLATLLNTYNCADLRNSTTDCLVEFLYTMPLDTLRNLVPLMVHWHTACQDAQTSGMGPTLGPYFPKRSSVGSGSSSMALKSSVRPPRPMLQMAFPHLGQETAKGLDEEYDRQLQEFYGQYHFYVDLMCRVAFMKDAVNQELITLSAMLGYEAAPLHFIHFPKLWLEVYNTSSIDRKYITMLVNTNYFTDYVELVILEERTCLTNIMIFNFLATYLPKVFDQIAKTDQMCKVLMSIKLDLENLVEKQISDVENNAMGILGDLKALSLFYLPTINGRGQTGTPLPPPAPTIPQLLTTLKQLNSYLEKLFNNLAKSSPSSSSSPGGVLVKKRRTEMETEGRPSTSAASSSMTPPSLDISHEKAAISRDLIMVLLGTLDTLMRGMSPPLGEEGIMMLVLGEDGLDPSSVHKTS